MNDYRNQLKSGCLSCILSDPERVVRTAVAQLIGTLARHELSSKGAASGGWPDLFTFIMARIDSQNPQVMKLLTSYKNIIFYSLFRREWLV